MSLSPSAALSPLAATSRSIALEGFKGAFGERSRTFQRDPVWAAFRELGSMLWLDTGDLDEASQVWTCEFSHLTTNNTLVNKQVQSGQFDSLIGAAAAQLRGCCSGPDQLSEEVLIREIGFILNCRVALRLIEAFDARVSVELHPRLASDIPGTVEWARRYYRICPERFIVKVPLTAAGYLSVRQLVSEGIPVNFTLGFSSRQNYLAAIAAQPQYVNVFMGRLNAFVADNGLGDGKSVGEKATLATQLALWQHRDQGNRAPTRLIGASTREAQQVIDLAGIDVFTLPPAVAGAVHERLSGSRARLSCCAERRFEIKMAPGLTARDAGLEALWELPDSFCRAVSRLSSESSFPVTASELISFLKANGVDNLFREWHPDEIEQIAADGKIPRFDRWKEGLRSGAIALDDLMSVSALQAFARDQKALDDRIGGIIRSSR